MGIWVYDSESEQVKPESPSSVKTKIFRLFGREIPVHQVFGGGKPADVLLWRNKKISASFLGSVTVAWIFFELLEYHLLTLVCHILIAALGLLFLWSKAHTFINKSPPRIPQVQILEDPFLQVVSALTIEINRGFAVLRDIASGKDLKKFLMQEFDMRRDITSKGLVRWGETHYSNHRFPMVDSFHEHLTVFEVVPLAKPLDNIGLKIDTPPAAPEKDKLIVLI
ncbi:hypothetical protein CsatA_010972 [Cannabis sativa]